MNNRITTLILTGIAATTMFSSTVIAQTTVDPGHPRVNEIDQRLNNQQERINNNVAAGTITPAQAGKDEARDARVEQQAAKDEAKNGGHLTKKEQRHLNKKLNKDSKKIHRQHVEGVKNQ